MHIEEERKRDKRDTGSIEIRETRKKEWKSNLLREGGWTEETGKTGREARKTGERMRVRIKRRKNERDLREMRKQHGITKRKKRKFHRLRVCLL